MMFYQKNFCVIALFAHVLLTGMESTERKGLTMPERYGVNLSSQKFDEIIFSGLEKGYRFSSDQVLCTLPQELAKKETDLYAEKELYDEEDNFYTRLFKQAQDNIDICVTTINKEIDGAWFTYGKWLQYRHAALQKLQDDKELLRKGLITEQNVVRACQYVDYSCVNKPEEIEPMYAEHLKRGVFGEKDVIQNLYIQMFEHMPVGHSGCVTILKSKNKISLQDFKKKPAYGIFYRRHINDISNSFSSEYDQERLKTYLQADPRYDEKIHGDNGVVWFKFPHEEGYDAGIDGKGTTWMELQEAKDKIRKLALRNSLLHMKETSSIKISIIALPISVFIAMIQCFGSGDRIYHSIIRCVGGGSVGLLLGQMHSLSFDPKERQVENIAKPNVWGVSEALFFGLLCYLNKNPFVAALYTGGFGIISTYGISVMENFKHIYSQHNIL